MGMHLHYAMICSWNETEEIRFEIFVVSNVFSFHAHRQKKTGELTAKATEMLTLNGYFPRA